MLYEKAHIEGVFPNRKALGTLGVQGGRDGAAAVLKVQRTVEFTAPMNDIPWEQLTWSNERKCVRSSSFEMMTSGGAS